MLSCPPSPSSPRPPGRAGQSSEETSAGQRRAEELLDRQRNPDKYRYAEDGSEIPQFVVTKVQSAEDLAGLSFWQQGDEAMYTASNLKARSSNRKHPLVTEVLDIWWAAATANANASKKKAKVTRSKYVTIFTKIGIALTEEGDEADPEGAHSEAEEAWSEDSKGNDAMNERLFLDSVFELADVWTVTVDPKEYADWLRQLFSRVGREHPPGFRDDDDVEQLPAGEGLRFAQRLAKVFPRMSLFLGLGKSSSDEKKKSNAADAFRGAPLPSVDEEADAAAAEAARLKVEEEERSEREKDEARRAAMEAHKAVRKAGQQQLKAANLMANMFRAVRAFKDLSKAKKAATAMQAATRGKQAREKLKEPEVSVASRPRSTLDASGFGRPGSRGALKTAFTPASIDMPRDPPRLNTPMTPRRSRRPKPLLPAGAEVESWGTRPSTAMESWGWGAVAEPAKRGVSSSSDPPGHPAFGGTTGSMPYDANLGRGDEYSFDPEGHSSFVEFGGEDVHDLGLGAWATDSSTSVARAAANFGDAFGFGGRAMLQSSSRYSTGSTKSVANAFGQRCTTPMANFVQGEHLWSCVLQAAPKRVADIRLPRMAPLTPMGDRHMEASRGNWATQGRWPTKAPDLLRKAYSTPTLHNPLSRVGARTGGAPILVAVRDPQRRLRMKPVTRPASQGGWRTMSAATSSFSYVNAHGKLPPSLL